MKQNLQLKMSQNLALTPQLQQSIRLLQLSTLELNQELETILEENPLLELADGENDYDNEEDDKNASSDEANTSNDDGGKTTDTPDEKSTLDTQERAESEEFDETSLHMRQLLKSRLVDLDLSVRALNCLKAADVETLGELVSFAKSDLLKFRNFGKKSLTELEDLIESKGLSFGMDISKYKLDKE